MAKTPKPQFTFPDPKFAYSRRGHYLHLSILTLATLSISAVAIFYSLGYQINWKAQTIEQTGLISLDSQTGRKNTTVTINGEVVATELPYRTGPLFPDTYQVTVARDGYQTWSRSVPVVENKVSSFRTIVLIKDTLVVRPATSRESTDYYRFVPDRAGITVNQNELWINGMFVTRLSKDIYGAQWFSGRDHVLYQAGDTVWLSDDDGRYSQALVTLPSSGPISIALLKDGQTLVYPSSGQLMAVDLFDN